MFKTKNRMTRDCGHSTRRWSETADTVQEMTRDCGHSTGMTRDCGQYRDDQRLQTQYRG
ncbi:unnamed protein product [Staurois parvus]|uniref:Uncharacterized protein n=1 Tax=Staurois parvus TaxID=386267 RepID=A0ABN9BYD9_9NEOB|nr:unnamed protein product [Staurois parvus]